MAVGYWCLPCAQDATRFREIITTLAKAQDAPVFEPHMSLGTLANAATDLIGVRRALTDLVLMPAAIDGTDAFTKSLFVRLAPSPGLSRARSLLETDPAFLARRAFDPHISLCYGTPPAGAADMHSVCSLLSVPVRFDRLAAVEISLPVETYDDVRAFTTVDIFCL